MAELSPMMQQYLEIKKQHKDEILSTASVTSTRCSSTMRSQLRKSWI